MRAKNDNGQVHACARTHNKEKGTESWKRKFAFTNHSRDMLHIGIRLAAGDKLDERMCWGALVSKVFLGQNLTDVHSLDVYLVHTFRDAKLLTGWLRSEQKGSLVNTLPKSLFQERLGSCWLWIVQGSITMLQMRGEIGLLSLVVICKRLYISCSYSCFLV